MNRQIKECRFNVAIDNGSSITVVSGFPKNINVSDGSYTYRPYYYTDKAFDEAINGNLRSQLGGYRFEAVLSWDRLINSQPLLDVLNNAYTNTAGEVIITFFPDASNTTVSEQVIVSDSTWTANLEGTMVRQPLTITLTGKKVTNTIPVYYKI